MPHIQPQPAFFFQVSTSDIYMIPLMWFRMSVRFVWIRIEFLFIRFNLCYFVYICFEPCSHFFSENGTLGWDVPSIKQLCTSCVTYKKKWDNGIISSWEGYSTSKDCLWIHHWVLLQFVHPSFSVPCKTDLNEKHPDGVSVYNFKHESWNQFIRAMDDELVSKYFEVHQEYPRFGIVWLGTQIMPVF